MPRSLVMSYSHKVRVGECKMINVNERGEYDASSCTIPATYNRIGDLRRGSADSVGCIVDISLASSSLPEKCRGDIPIWRLLGFKFVKLFVADNTEHKATEHQAIILGKQEKNDNGQVVFVVMVR